MGLLTKVFGTSNERIINKIKPIAAYINSLEPKMMSLTDAEIRQQTDKFKERLTKGETVDDILPEAFATVREASRRVLIAPNPDSPNRTMRHFDVQLIGGVVFHQGKIAEMTTGEGKTPAAPPPARLAAPLGGGGPILSGD